MTPDEGRLDAGRPEGRPCDAPEACNNAIGEAGYHYRCERAGLLGTSYIDGRVRYVGVLQDPNEVALIAAVVVPFAIAFFRRRRSPGTLLALVFTLGIAAAAVVLSKSRGGQLVYLTVLATYFLARHGWRGVVVGTIGVSPMLVLAGREGEEAAQSTVERLECWYEAVGMFRDNPLLRPVR